MATSASPGRPGVSLWERALDLIFPPRCVGCERLGVFICEECEIVAPVATPPRCGRCWRSVAAGGPCDRCRAEEPAFAALRSPYLYDGMPRDAVIALKFKGVSSIAPVMAAKMAALLSEWEPDARAIVPVPLSRRRRRERGYDQAELLAKELARVAGVPFVPGVLVRSRETAPQTHQRDRQERRRNIEGAFARGPAAVEGPVLLVDDVVTTGATLDACARVLESEGLGPVCAITFARDDAGRSFG